MHRVTPRAALRSRREALFGLVIVAGLMVGGCGSTTRIPQVASQTPLTATRIRISETGSTRVSADTTAVRFSQDDAGAVVISLQVTSHAATTVTVSIQATLRDPGGAIIGDAAGSVDGVTPGATVPVRLSGPPPHGTIARAIIEVTDKPVP